MDGACHFENRRSEPKHLVTFRVSVPALAQVMAGYFETVPRRPTHAAGRLDIKATTAKALTRSTSSVGLSVRSPTSVTFSCIARPAATLRLAQI